MKQNPFDIRPWGNYSVITEKDKFKLKLIEVNPGERLSYQYHHKRSETWVIIEGIASITIDDKTSNHRYGDTIVIPKKSKHRIHNVGNEILRFIEIQTGEYFGEDDIVRLDDDYNRQ